MSPKFALGSLRSCITSRAQLFCFPSETLLLHVSTAPALPVIVSDSLLHLRELNKRSALSATSVRANLAV